MSMTWGELKKLVDESEGVSDDTEIWYFDFSGHDEVCVNVDETMGLSAG